MLGVDTDFIYLQLHDEKLCHNYVEIGRKGFCEIAPLVARVMEV